MGITLIKPFCPSLANAMNILIAKDQCKIDSYEAFFCACFKKFFNNKILAVHPKILSITDKYNQKLNGHLSA